MSLKFCYYTSREEGVARVYVGPWTRKCALGNGGTRAVNCARIRQRSIMGSKTLYMRCFMVKNRPGLV